MGVLTLQSLVAKPLPEGWGVGLALAQNQSRNLVTLTKNLFSSFTGALNHEPGGPALRQPL